jgi:hypothetical protein
LTEAAREAAHQGNVILVGRGTRQLVGDIPGSIHLRLVARSEWRAKHMAAREGHSEDELAANCVAVDLAREQFK